MRVRLPVGVIGALHGRRASEAPVAPANTELHPVVRVLTLGRCREAVGGPFKPGRRFRIRPLFPGVLGWGGAGRPRARGRHGRVRGQPVGALRVGS